MCLTKEVRRRAEDKYKVLENKMKNAEAEREKELKAAQQKLNAAKTKADAFNKKLKQKQQVNLASDNQPQSSAVDLIFFFSILFIDRTRMLLPWSSRSCEGSRPVMSSRFRLWMKPRRPSRNK